MKSFNNKSYVHPIAQQYFDRISAAGGNVLDKVNINNFVVGLSRLISPELWICWPMISTQNIGTGTTVFSLGGLGSLNGLLINGPTWSSNGIVSTAASVQYMEVTMPNYNGFAPSFYLYAVWLDNTSAYSSGVDALIGGSNTGDLTLSKRSGPTVTGRRNANASTINSATIVNGWHDSAYFCNTSGSQLFLDGVSAGTDTYALTQSSNTNIFRMAASPTTATGTTSQSFAFFCLTRIDYTVLRNLYKNTIGTGLSIP